MDNEPQMNRELQQLDDSLYNGSRLMRWIFGPGRPEETDDTRVRHGLLKSLAQGHTTRTLLFCIAWIAAFLVVSGLEESLLKGNYSPAGLTQLGFVEDWYTLSIVLSLGLLLLATRKTISLFNATFHGKNGLRKAIDEKRFSKDRYLELTRQGFDFIQHRGKKARMGFAILVAVTVTYLALSLWAHVNEQSDNDYWYKVSNPLGNALWTIFVVVIVLFIGVELAWRILAMIYQTRKIIKTLGKENALVIPARVSEKDGIGLVFSLAYWMALVPLTPIVSLVAWFAFSGGLMYDQAIVAAMIIAATALIAFFSTAEALISAAKREKANEINEISNAIDGLFRQFKEISENEGVHVGSALDSITNRMSILIQVREAKMGESVWPTDSFVQLIGILLIQTVLIVISPDIGGFPPWG